MVLSRRSFVFFPFLRPWKQGSVSLTMADAVDILADYSVIHQNTPLMGTYGGLSDYRERTIYISNHSDLADRRDSVIHEFLHILYRVKGIPDPGEEVIREQTSKIYRSLFS